MANSLLDFVMSLVRDSDAAARYAADPAQTIADARLTDVTSADVNQLIPVVSESMSMAAPTAGDSFDPFHAADPGSNVWASGAATAAFDAFGDHATAAGFDTSDTSHELVSQVIDAGQQAPTPGFEDIPSMHVDPSVEAGFDDASTHFSAPVIDDVPVDHAPLVDDWGHPAVDDHHVDDGGAGFELFS
jgi:hypothetical protein